MDGYNFDSIFITFNALFKLVAFGCMAFSQFLQPIDKLGGGVLFIGLYFV